MRPAYDGERKAWTLVIAFLAGCGDDASATADADLGDADADIDAPAGRACTNPQLSKVVCN